MVSFTDIMKPIWAFSSLSLHLGIFTKRMKFLFLANKIGFLSCKEYRNVDFFFPEEKLRINYFFLLEYFVRCRQCKILN